MYVHELIPLLRRLRWVEVRDVAGNVARIGYGVVDGRVIVAVDTGGETFDVFTASGVRPEELERFARAIVEYARAAPVVRRLAGLVRDFLSRSGAELRRYTVARDEVNGEPVLWAVDSRGWEYIVVKLPEPVDGARYLVAVHTGSGLTRVYSETLEGALANLIGESRILELNVPGVEWLRLSQPLASVAPGVRKRLMSVVKEAMIENMYRREYIGTVREYECKICGKVFRPPSYVSPEDVLRVLAAHLKKRHPEAWEELKKAARQVIEYIVTSPTIERSRIEQVIESVVNKERSRGFLHAL